MNIIFHFLILFLNKLNLSSKIPVTVAVDTDPHFLASTGKESDHHQL